MFTLLINITLQIEYIHAFEFFSTLSWHMQGPEGITQITRDHPWDSCSCRVIHFKLLCYWRIFPERKNSF
jgi:hypothetical protein